MKILSGTHPWALVTGLSGKLFCLTENDRDSRKFGLSPIPDKAYNVHFYAFEKPTKLSAHDDTIVFPEQYSNVITSRVRYYVWQFKESPQQAAFALDDYKKAMKSMKSNLINPTPRAMTDDRRYF